MTRDPVIRAYLIEVHRQIGNETEALTTNTFEQLSQVTRLQGRLDGLKMAMQLLEKVLEEQSQE